MVTEKFRNGTVVVFASFRCDTPPSSLLGPATDFESFASKEGLVDMLEHLAGISEFRVLERLDPRIIAQFFGLAIQGIEVTQGSQYYRSAELWTPSEGYESFMTGC
jgi:hypothetical protein